MKATTNMIETLIISRHGSQHAKRAIAVIGRLTAGIDTREGQKDLRDWVTGEFAGEYKALQHRAALPVAVWFHADGVAVSKKNVTNAKDAAITALRTECKRLGYILSVNLRGDKAKATLTKIKVADPVDPVDAKGVQGGVAENDGKSTAEENGSASTLGERLERILSNCNGLDDGSLLYLIGRLTDQLSADGFQTAIRRVADDSEIADLQIVDVQQRQFAAAYTAALNS